MGAGISGLALAWYLEKYLRNWEIILLEKENRVGGWIRTNRIEGMLFEHGPRSFRMNQNIKLFDELGLTDQLIEAKTKTKYIVYQQQLERVPEHLLSLLTTTLGRKCIKALIGYPFRKKNTIEDQTVAEFFAQRFGQQFVDIFIDPLMAGIYAAHPSTLSKQACLPQFSKTIKVCSFLGGMQLLPDRLAEKIEAEICLNTTVRAIHEYKESVEVEHCHGSIHADMLFSTLPSIKNFLPKEDPLSLLLPSVIHNSVIIVGIGFRESFLLQGFGFLAPSQEEKELLGILFDSGVFPEQNGDYPTRLSVMLGGDRAPYLLALSDEQLQQLAQQFCKKYLKIFSEPAVSVVTRAHQGIPAYSVGHMKQVRCVEEHLQERRISILGTSLYGVSLTACVTQAEIVAMTFAKNSRYSYMWG